MRWRRSQRTEWLGVGASAPTKAAKKISRSWASAQSAKRPCGIALPTPPPCMRQVLIEKQESSNSGIGQTATGSDDGQSRQRREIEICGLYRERRDCAGGRRAAETGLKKKTPRFSPGRTFLCQIAYQSDHILVKEKVSKNANLRKCSGAKELGKPERASGL